MFLTSRSGANLSARTGENIFASRGICCCQYIYIRNHCCHSGHEQEQECLWPHLNLVADRNALNRK
jgi:hypothetical protein